MATAAVICWITFAVVLGLALLGPRRWYHSVQAPMLRNPQANEPSETGYAVAAVANWAAVLLMGGVALALTTSAARDLTESDVSSLAWSVASEVDSYDADGLLGPNVEAIAAGHEDEGKFRVTEAGRADDVERFELTNAEGDFPHCIEVTTERGPLGEDFIDATTWDATVEDGPCD